MTSKRRLLLFAIFWMLPVLVPCTAYALSISVSYATADPGATDVAVTIDVDDATGIAGGDLTLTYDAVALTAKQASPTSLLTGALFTTNLTTAGEVKISLAGTSGITSGSGALITITFDVKSDATPGNYELKLTRAVFRNAQVQAPSRSPHSSPPENPSVPSSRGEYAESRPVLRRGP